MKIKGTAMNRICAALLVAFPLAAAAQEAPSWKFSGYGTVGLAHSDNRQADYLIDEFKPNGPGYTHAWSADVDSRLGLQLSGQFTPSLSAVVQVLAQQDENNSYRPELEWANVRWQPTPEFSLRAGRIVLPVFMMTDTRRIGYATPWVRPPVEMYAMVPVSHNDGVDASYRLEIGSAANTFQLAAGQWQHDFPTATGYGGGTAKAKRIVEFIDTFEQGPLLLRLGYGQAQLEIPQFSVARESLLAFGPLGEPLANRYLPPTMHLKYLGVGMTYDPGNWFVMGEWGRFQTKSLLGTKVAWYGSAGYRIGKFTPYVTYARASADSNTSDPGIPLAGLPPPVAAGAATINALLNMQLNLLPRQRTVSVGARWDFAKNAAFKVQYDHVDLDAGSTGTFGNVQPGFQPGGRVGIFSAVVDFVF
jgi:predicted porin